MFAASPYSVHNVYYVDTERRWHSESGSYDLTAEQAWEEFARRAWRVRAS